MPKDGKKGSLNRHFACKRPKWYASCRSLEVICENSHAAMIQTIQTPSLADSGGE
jgi:hypothetical protein